VLGTCQPVAQAGCFSTTTIDGIFTYATSGGGEISIDLKKPGYHTIQIRHKAYPGFSLRLWGHRALGDRVFQMEHLNDRHIKNRLGSRRTIIFPDGAKMTLVTSGEEAPALSLSIYDGSQVHHINLTCGVLEYSNASSADLARRMDEAEADGEAGGFEITDTGLIFFNLYTEDEPGRKVENRYDLGELDRNAPDQVKDHYEDPRLGNT